MKEGLLSEEHIKKGNKGLIIVILIFVIAIALIVMQPTKQEIQPTKKPLTQPPEKIKLNDKGIPFGPLTTVYFDGKELRFALKNDHIITINTWHGFNLTENNRIIIGERTYTVMNVDKQMNTFTFYADETSFTKEETITRSFQDKQIEGPITFSDIYGEPLNYYYSVIKVIDQESGEEYYRMRLFLAETRFELQFNKTLYFTGTDTDEDKKVDRPYYLTDEKDFGFNPDDSMHLIAHFYLDEDSDSKYDIKYFEDTANSETLKIDNSLSNYKYFLEFNSGNGLTGLTDNEKNQIIYTDYGSQIQKEYSKITIRMPKD